MNEPIRKNLNLRIFMKKNHWTSISIPQFLLIDHKSLQFNPSTKKSWAFHQSLLQKKCTTATSNPLTSNLPLICDCNGHFFALQASLFCLFLVCDIFFQYLIYFLHLDICLCCWGAQDYHKIYIFLDSSFFFSSCAVVFRGTV